MRALAILGLALVSCDSRPSVPPPPQAPANLPLTIYAAASLNEMLTEVAHEWSRRTGRPSRLQFEASSTLARQINEGAPADVFLSAAPEWVDKVTTLEHMDWRTNRLVLVVPKESKDVELRSLESLALANEQVPAGKYARAALAWLGVRPPPRTIYGSNVRDVLSKVSEGGAQAGIVYATDARIDPGVRISYTFPPESHPRILYTAGLLTPGGRGFYEALLAPWAKEIALRHGFADLD